MLKITYGYNVDPLNPDPLICLVTRMLENFSVAMIPGRWLVDQITVLKYLPGWFPGCGFQNLARQHRRINNLTIDIPYRFTEKQIRKGTNAPSLVSEILTDRQDAPDTDEEHAIKWAAGSMYGAAADTTVAVLAWFFRAMVLFPNVQQKAQEELDHALGLSLARVSDRVRLPYTSGLVAEALRWRPVVSMGMPHVADEDDEYAGYRIPKGALLIPAVWWYGNDPTVYRDPEIFDPERFLSPRNEPAPDFAFGFGRRVCPGRHLAESSLFVTIAQTLAVFEVRKALDANGKEVQPSREAMPGFLALPVPYEYRIVARSEKHAELIGQVETDHPRLESNAKDLEPFDVDVPE
jgi:fumagillin biosynthesis cytochrome P450 monooxygenase